MFQKGYGAATTADYDDTLCLALLAYSLHRK